MVDTQLFTKLARQFLRGTTLPPDQLYKLGVKMALILGAQQVLNDGWATQSKDCTADVSLIPECWAAKMDETLAGHSVGIMIFNTEDCWMEVVPDENPDFQQFGKQIAVVCDRSVGSGAARSLHWEITAMDPQEDDILKEMLRKNRGGQKQTHMELTAAIAKHHALRMAANGLPVETQEGLSETGSPAPPPGQVSPQTPRKARMSDAMLRRLDKFTPSPAVNNEHSLASLDKDKLRKAKIIVGSPPTRTWPNSKSTRNTVPAELKRSSTAGR
jgi:uncharacterized protein YcbK (DUF882 family)